MDKVHDEIFQSGKACLFATVGGGRKRDRHKCFSFWIGRESKKLKWRTFTGPEKLTLFKKLNMLQVFPEIENVGEIHDLWQELTSY